MENSQYDRYIASYNDYGFKKLFGTEMNKDLLIGFLNALFLGQENIKDIRYLPNERLSQYCGRRAIFDDSMTNSLSSIWRCPSSTRKWMNWKHHSTNGSMP